MSLWHPGCKIQPDRLILLHVNIRNIYMHILFVSIYIYICIYYIHVCACTVYIYIPTIQYSTGTVHYISPRWSSFPFNCFPFREMRPGRSDGWSLKSWWSWSGLHSSSVRSATGTRNQALKVCWSRLGKNILLDGDRIVCVHIYTHTRKAVCMYTYVCTYTRTCKCM